MRWLCAHLLTASSAVMLAQAPDPPSLRTGDIHNTGVLIVGPNNKIIYSQPGSASPPRDIRSIGYDAPLKLHRQFELEAIVLDFDKPDRSSLENRRILTPDQLEARVRILTALKRYAQALADIEDGSTTYRSDDVSAGNDLQALGSDGAHSLLNEFPAAADVQKGVATALVRLGSFLVAQKHRSDLPQILVNMDPALTQLCSLLAADTQILRTKSHLDFEQMASEQALFIRQHDKQLSASERRDEIRRLPIIFVSEESADAAFQQLALSLRRFAAIHRAAAAVAQTKRKTGTPRKDQLNMLLEASASL